jgi:YbdK family carboxylate-amine ligase
VIEVGATLGVEEEYHLVDASTFALADAPAVVPAALDALGRDAQSEISTSQLEVATPVSSSLAEVRAHLVRLRRGADAVAQAHGCRILSAASHPTAHWSDQRLTDAPRYLRVQERYGVLARQQLIVGQHVHVSVPDPDLAVDVCDRLRPDLPLLIAMSASSPFWEGTDTGYASYRTLWFARFPVTGSQEVLRTRAAYDALVEDLVASGVVDDARGLYWDARPSTLYPTVEVRVLDACPRLDDAVLLTGLSRALVRVCAREAQRELPFPAPRPELQRAARWRAARCGLEARLVDTRRATKVPAAQLVRELLERVREDLEGTGDWDEVSGLTEQLLARGTSAAQQRRTAAGHGLSAVTRELVEQTTSA